MDLVELVQRSEVKTLTRLWLTLLRTYFRIEVEGLEHIPRKGGALIAPNHSGFAGADAVLLTFLIKRETKRRARILAHRSFFDFSKTLASISESFGLRKASVDGGAHQLKNDHLVILFPEGETGNFKTSFKRYRLQAFHTGFLRMALEAKVPIIPCVIIGAEESHLNLGNLNFSKIIKGLRIPLPVNWVPLPAKWRIVFLPKIEHPLLVKHTPEELLASPELLRRLTRSIQRHMQLEIRKRLRDRKYVYFSFRKNYAKFFK